VKNVTKDVSIVKTNSITVNIVPLTESTKLQNVHVKMDMLKFSENVKNVTNSVRPVKTPTPENVKNVMETESTPLPVVAQKELMTLVKTLAQIVTNNVPNVPKKLITVPNVLKDILKYQNVHLPHHLLNPPKSSKSQSVPPRLSPVRTVVTLVPKMNLIVKPVVKTELTPHLVIVLKDISSLKTMNAPNVRNVDTDVSPVRTTNTIVKNVLTAESTLQNVTVLPDSMMMVPQLIAKNAQLTVRPAKLVQTKNQFV